MKCKKLRLFIIVILFIVQSCSTNKQILSSVPLDVVDTSEIIRNTKRAEVNFKNLRNRVKVEFNDGKSIQSIILSLRATEDESLWISASMIVPIAKIFLDNERIIFYEKFQKTYVDQDISQLMILAGIKKPVKLIQNLLFGKPLIDINKSGWERVKNSNFYVGNNSGPLNLAAALNVKSFGLIANDPISELKYSKIDIIKPDNYIDESRFRDRIGMKKLKPEKVFQDIVRKIK